MGLDYGNVGLVINQHQSQTGDVNTGEVELVTNTTKDAFILHNTKNVDKVSDEIILEIEQNTVSCPQCRQLLEHAQRLLHKVKTIDKKVTIGICDHCKTKGLIEKSCYECEEIVKKFATTKGELNEESKQRIRIWLLKVKKLLKDVLIEVEDSGKRTRRTYSDPYINRLSKFPPRYTAPEPAVKQMFYTAYQQRKKSIGIKPTLEFKEMSLVSEISLKEQRNQNSLFENWRMQTSSEETLASGIRKYHSEETLHVTKSDEAKMTKDFSYCFPKPDIDRKSHARHISSAELISNTRDILRNKAIEDKIKHERKNIVAYEDTERLARAKRKVTEESQTKLTKGNYEQNNYSVGVKTDSMEKNKIAKDVENQFVNSKTEILTSEEKNISVNGKKHTLVDVDTKHAKDIEKSKLPVRETQKSKQLIEKQSTVENKKEQPRIEKNTKMQEDTQKSSGRDTKILAKRDTKKVVEEIQKAEGETKKPVEREAKKIVVKTKNGKEKKTVHDGEKEVKVRNALEDKKRTVEGENNRFLEGKTMGDVKKKRDEEKSRAEYKNHAKEDYTKSSQGDKKIFIEKDNKRELPDRDHLKDNKISEPTERNKGKKNVGNKSGIEPNTSAKKSNELIAQDINKTKPNNKEVLNPKVKKNDDEYLMHEKSKEKPTQDELKNKRKETTPSKDKPKEPIKLKDNIVEEQLNKKGEKRELTPKATKAQELATINTGTISDKKLKESAEHNYKRSKEKPNDTSEPEKSTTTKNIELPTIKELRMDLIKIRRMSQNDLPLLVKLKHGNINQTKLRKPRRLSQISALKIKEHKFHTNKKSSACDMCIDSDFELDVESTIFKKEKPFELANIIIGQKLFKYKPPLKNKKSDLDIIPAMVTTDSKEDLILVEKKDILEKISEEIERKPPLSLLHTKGTKSTEQEIPKGITRYALSDRTFIDKGWTMLPTEKVVRKMNVYRMRPAHPEFDWFEHNKNKRLMQYDTGEKLAEFDDNGRGRWYYRNGRLALDYYDAEEVNAQQRFVVYSSGEPDERGRSHPITILATFDYLGNGIVFDHSGKLRLKYNQTEGVVLDREIGPVSHWKWHTLNDPPVLQQVMIDTQMSHKDPEILKLGGPSDRKARPDNEEMIAIEFDNFINEKSKKLTQTFKPFQIKMKALKINKYFSLRVLDQATIYLIYRDGATNIKMNIGMLLDHKEIVDTDTAEVGEVSNNLERFPARTDSIAALQRNVARAQHFEHSRMERERRLHPPALSRSADRLIAAASHPLRPPLRTMPSGSTTAAGECYCRLNRKPSINLYYDTRLV